jgi:nicotinamide mononucleotide transporter
VFYHIGLYAESLLNVYYLVASILGIYLWQEGKVASITSNTRRDWFITLGIIAVAWLMLTFLLQWFTSSNVPYLDSLVTATAWAGTWLLLRRKVENWLVLNVSNAIAIPLHIYKGLELTAVLTSIYFIIAVNGYLSWRKKGGG